MKPEVSAQYAAGEIDDEEYVRRESRLSRN
jgi:uncharacterized membrane protein